MKKMLLFITLISFTITQAQIVNIPDVNFKSILLDANYYNIAKDQNGVWVGIDTNFDYEIDEWEAQNIASLNIEGAGISDLTGIEYFTNLMYLDCSENNINNLDLNNYYLSYLDCSSSSISSLSVANCDRLNYLNCEDNNLWQLWVGDNEYLTELRCGANPLTQFNLVLNGNLRYLQCDVTPLTNLNLSNLLELTYLDCGFTQLTNLDLTNNIHLTDLIVRTTQIDNLNLTNNVELETLWCQNNLLMTDLDLSHNINLTRINCKLGNLVSLNLKNGNNSNFEFNPLDGFNSGLQSVCVDELNTPLTDLIQSETTNSVNFTTDCSTLSIDYNYILDFSIYPIPTENILNINSKTEIITIEIYSKLGQLIKNTTENKVDVSNLTQGLYFVKVEDINGSFGVKKFIKR